MHLIYKSYTISRGFSGRFMSAGCGSALALFLLVFVSPASHAAGTAVVPLSELKPFGPNPFLVSQKVADTNGLEPVIEILDFPLRRHSGRVAFFPPVCVVKVVSHVANDFTCMTMPASDLCNIALFDDQKKEVEKTIEGRSYGNALSDQDINKWHQQWIQDQKGDGSQTTFESIFAAEYPDPRAQARIQICAFSLKDTFKITRSGNYELHVQLRLFQPAKDVFGNFHFPAVDLPETVIPVYIDSRDIPL